MSFDNIDKQTVEGFGREWNVFDQSNLSESERNFIFNLYFSDFPWTRLPASAVGFDLGCGSGRWAYLVAPKVSKLYCIDPSRAINVARTNLACFSNCIFLNESDSMDSLPDSSMDFGYSLGVLHHIPNTQSALSNCYRKLKPGAPFLLYLYYALDNRPLFFRLIWRVSDILRSIISRLPFNLRYIVSQLIAFFVYLPLSRLSLFLEQLGFSVSHIPLSAYRHNSFYTMRTDALDRFGTKLEKRFTRPQITRMLLDAGFVNISFADHEPYWLALSYRD